MKKNYLEELTFDETFITDCEKKVTRKLIEYVEMNILPEYQLNDGGHNIEHIKYVLKRAFEITKDYEINYDILYTCVVYHDIACHIDRENHEMLSAKRVYEDAYLKEFFTKEEMMIIKQAIEDHRASLKSEPRNLYGKILSSADRKVEVKVYLISSLSFVLKTEPEISMEEAINSSYDFAIKKFGKEGYAIKKNYVNDQKYKQFLDDLQYLIENKELYFELSEIVYKELITKDKMIIKKENL